jgi:hypothetical protein
VGCTKQEQRLLPLKYRQLELKHRQLELKHRQLELKHRLLELEHRLLGLEHWLLGLEHWLLMRDAVGFSPMRTTLNIDEDVLMAAKEIPAFPQRVANLL